MSIGAGPQMSKYPYGFANGVSIRGIPLAQTHTGQVFWVYSGSSFPPGGAPGADGNPGTFLRPCATLAGALVKCVAGRGDIIFVKAGHTETISTATALNLNKAGVAIIGLGQGSSRPTWTLDTATTTTITVSAANVSIHNCAFGANFLNIAALFTLTTATYFTLEQCEIYENSASLNFLKIIDTSTTNGAANGLTVLKCRIVQLAASGACMLLAVNGNIAYLTIQGCYYQAATTGAGAVIPIAAGKVITAALIMDNIFKLTNAAGTATGYLITTNQTTNTGFVTGNFDNVLCTSPLPITLLSGLGYGLHYHADTQDRCGYLVPAADS